jgi:D-glycero-D-manno-heptose 1,7-bisphosphate phosphatase
MFIDRDGVVNVDYGYVHEPHNCVFIDRIFEVVRIANDADYKVVIVTNQAGIGRRYFSANQFLEFTDWMLGEFSKMGARIDAVYHCPHHPEFGVGSYKIGCDCRKPHPGMFNKARDELDLDMATSLIVGDKLSDLEAGARAGVGRGFLYTLGSDEAVKLPRPNYARISSLLELKYLL